MKKLKKERYKETEEEKRRKDREDEARKAHEEAVRRGKERKEFLEKAKIGAEAVKNYEKQHLKILLLGYQESFKKAADRMEEDWMHEYYTGIQMLLKEHKLTEKQKKLIDLEKIENTRREVFRALIPKKIKEATDDFSKHYDEYFLSDFAIEQIKEKAKELKVELKPEQKTQLQELKEKVLVRKDQLRVEMEKEQLKEEAEKKRKQEEDTKKHHQLNNEQYEHWKELLVQTKIGDWPESLKDYVDKVGAKMGLCGEVIMYAVAEWLKEQNKTKKKK